MSKRRLGRGLSSLLSGRPESVAEGDAVNEIPVTKIKPNRWQPRDGVSDDGLAGLVESIRRDGVLQPVVVREAGEGLYELVAGERRWRAATKAGVATIPAVVRAVGEDRLLELALIENVQREDLNAMEQARAYRQVMSTLELTQEAAAKRLGLQRSTLANALRLLELPEDLQGLVSRGTLSAGHARAILGLPDPESQMALAKRVVAEGLSVRATEGLVAELLGRPGKSGRAVKEKAPHIRELEDRLKRTLGLKVSVREKRRGGRIIIDFGSHDDFDRLMGLLGVPPEEEL